MGLMMGVATLIALCTCCFAVLALAPAPAALDSGGRRRLFRNGPYGPSLALCAAALAALALIAPATAGADPDRHFEKVSPAAKGDTDITGDGVTTVAGKRGDAVVYSSRTPFGDALGSAAVGQTQYLARRSGEGWQTHAITPLGRPDAVQTLLAATRQTLFSDDLDRSLLWGYDLPAVADDTPDRINLYVQDTASLGLQAATATKRDVYPFSDFLNQEYWGLSADARHVPFVSTGRLLPEITSDPGVPNVYVWHDGVLKVGGVLPDGSVPVAGSTITAPNIRGTISSDGSRLAFSSSGQLYLRIDDSRAVWVSQPEGSDQSEPVGVAFQGMTPDGRNVFFVSDSPLSDEDTTPGPDLYRFTVTADPAHDANNLTLISNDGQALSDPIHLGEPLVGMSDDAQRVYWHTPTNFLMLWDRGTIKTVAAGIGRSPSDRTQLTLGAMMPGHGRVSSSGRWFAYINEGEMYVYDADEDVVRCASCGGVGPAADVTVVAALAESPISLILTGARPRFLGDNGRVFFSTKRALVPEDVNGVADTYMYDPVTDERRLLTTGKGGEPAMFVDASASGDDVFFVTRGRLTGDDRDDYVDLYDARVGPAPPWKSTPEAPPPCDGAGCEPLPAAPPADEAVATRAVGRPGDGVPVRRRIVVRRSAAFRGARGSLAVRLTGGGRLRWRGGGVRSGSLARTTSGRAKVALRLTATARRRLARGRSFTTSLRLTFTADGQATRTTTVRLTFRPAKKGS